MSIEGQGHFFTIYFPGFVCFMLYLDKISGERLQDHWSSGWTFLPPYKGVIQDGFFFQFCVCGTVSSMLSGLKTRSLGLNTLGTT